MPLTGKDKGAPEVKRKGDLFMKRCIAILLALLALSACGAGEQPADPGPESGPPPVSEPASSKSAPSETSSPEPEESSAPEGEPSEEIPNDAPDPGAGLVEEYGREALRLRVEAMESYLEENLDPGDYSEIWGFYGPDGCGIEIPTPSPDVVKAVVERYTGETVPVEYLPAAFSKKQLEQSREDLKKFLEEHPEIEGADWRSQLALFSGWIINLKEKNDKVTEFVNTYPIQDIYEVVVGEVEFPD